MQQEYLGDSYDLVKRFFCQVLDSIAPLHAYPKFVPAAIRDSYTTVTGIPILGPNPHRPVGILLDPDTGIPLPAESLDGATIQHVSLPFIAMLNTELRPRYMICFDQSYHRKHELNREQQREKKREYLRTRGLSAFYYVSHAPFLFTAHELSVLCSIINRLVSAGIPRSRFEPSELS